MRLTVVGCGTAQPQPDTPASGLLVESGDTRLLLDCGQGVIARLSRRIDPRHLSAVVVGHLHADHYVDLVGLRYLFPWAGRSPRRLPVHLPPGGQVRMTELASAVSERPAFFDDAFAVADFDPAAKLAVGELRVRFIRGQHYVPAWGVEVTDPAGRRIVYAGDTGPNALTVEAARRADLFVCEATLDCADDDDEVRGHLTIDEAIDMAEAAQVERALIVHYPSARRSLIRRRCVDRGGLAAVALPDMVVDLSEGMPTCPGDQSPLRAPVEVG